jgi:4-hydroxybenzoate polyprenyltransferase
VKQYKAFIWSNIPIALDAAAWTGLTYKALHITTDWVMVFISFGFTWLFYTKDRTDASPSDLVNNPERTAWYARQTMIKPIMWIVAAELLICLSQRLSILIPALIGIVPCLFYTKQLTIKGYTFTLKALPGIKALLVAFLWVILTVVFPTVTIKTELPTGIITQLSLMIGFFVMLQINTNDLRDIEGDTQEGVKSFAVLLDDKKARLLGILMIALGVYFGWHLFEHMPLLIFSVFLIFRTFMYKKEADIYWQLPISLQGVLAYWIL